MRRLLLEPNVATAGLRSSNESELDIDSSEEVVPFETLADPCRLWLSSETVHVILAVSRATRDTKL